MEERHRRSEWQEVHILAQSVAPVWGANCVLSESVEGVLSFCVGVIFNFDNSVKFTHSATLKYIRWMPMPIKKAEVDTMRAIITIGNA